MYAREFIYTGATHAMAQIAIMSANISNVADANVWRSLKENHASYDGRSLQNEISFF